MLLCFCALRCLSQHRPVGAVVQSLLLLDDVVVVCFFWPSKDIFGGGTRWWQRLDIVIYSVFRVLRRAGVPRGRQKRGDAHLAFNGKRRANWGNYSGVDLTLLLLLTAVMLLPPPSISVFTSLNPKQPEGIANGPATIVPTRLEAKPNTQQYKYCSSYSSNGRSDIAKELTGAVPLTANGPSIDLRALFDIIHHTKWHRKFVVLTEAPPSAAAAAAAAPMDGPELTEDESGMDMLPARISLCDVYSRSHANCRNKHSCLDPSMSTHDTHSLYTCYSTLNSVTRKRRSNDRRTYLNCKKYNEAFDGSPSGNMPGDVGRWRVNDVLVGIICSDDRFGTFVTSWSTHGRHLFLSLQLCFG